MSREKFAEIKRLAEIKALLPLEQLIYWMKERDTIRVRKTLGRPKPWTGDPILRDYRFCNVRRMDDAVSAWLLEHWYLPFFGNENMLPAVALARHFNQPETLAAIGFPVKWDAERVKEVAHSLKARGRTVFNAAYIIPSGGKGDKINYVVDRVVAPLARRPPTLYPDNLPATHRELLCRDGLGSFLAGQIVADLRWALPGTWQGKDDWAPIGPGSKKGMNLLLNRPIDAPLSQDEFNRHLVDLMATCKPRLPRGFMDRLEAHDVQNCLCEYSKYHRTLYGYGKPKRKYPGGGDSEA